MITINDPQTVAAVTSVFEAYETALLANDVSALQGFFWRDPAAVRFGVTEQLYGYDEIAAFRRDRVVNFRHRRPRRLTVSTFGTEFASVMFEYDSDIGGRERHGRQSQVWASIEGTWKIVSAHISLARDDDPSQPGYVAAALAALNLKPDSSLQPAIEKQFATTAALAAPLMAFELPAETEPASVFRP